MGFLRSFTGFHPVFMGFYMVSLSLTQSLRDLLFDLSSGP